MKSVKRYQQGGRPRITQYFRPMTKEEMTGIRESLQDFMKERRKRKEDRITEERKKDKVSRIKPIGADDLDRELKVSDSVLEYKDPDLPVNSERDLEVMLEAFKRGFKYGGKMKVSKKKKKRY